MGKRLEPKYIPDMTDTLWGIGIQPKYIPGYDGYGIKSYHTQD